MTLPDPQNNPCLLSTKLIGFDGTETHGEGCRIEGTELPTSLDRDIKILRKFVDRRKRKPNSRLGINRNGTDKKRK